MDQMLEPARKRQVATALLAVLIALAIFVGVKAIVAIKEYSYIGRNNYPSNVISVNGKGEVVAVPDTGDVSFSVVENAKNVKDAQDASAKKINAIIDALKALGIEEKDIKTVGYNSYPKYEYTQGVCTNYGCPGGKQILTGYEVSQTIDVKIRKTDQAGDVLTKIGDLGASNISGLNFIVDDMDKITAEARDKAIEDAKAKAQELADSLGVRLRKIVNYYDSSGGPIYYAEGMGGAMMDKSMMSAAPQATVPQLPTGENKVTAQVTITYEIE